MGQKGFQVLNAAVTSGYKDQVTLVVIGKDGNVSKDFADEIVNLCIKYRVEYCFRNEISKMPDSLVSHIALAAGWRWLIKDEYHQLIVFHDSLLPKYRGFNPLVTSLLNQDQETGVTAIIAGKDFDRGDIVESVSLKLTYPTKISLVISQISDLYFYLAQSILSKLLLDKLLEGVSQDDTKASYSVWRDEEDYRINWSCSAESIVHFISCLSFPYKGASTLCDGRLIRILDAVAVPDVEIANRDIGKVIFVVDSKPVVICGKGLLQIEVAVNDEGKNILPFKSFRMRFK